MKNVALLRAVNLAGRNMVGMAELRALLGKLGLENAQSLLQSGNLVFDGDGRSSAALEVVLEAAAKKQLSLDTSFFVRTPKDWKELLASNPFLEEAKNDPSHLVVVFLKKPVAAAKVTELQSAIKDREVVRAKGRHAFAYYPDGIGRSRLTMVLIEKKLGAAGTARNWNTILKIGAMLAPG